LALSAELHPDRVHQRGDAEKNAAQQRYTELNAAYNCLRDPKERLRHLLELELGAKPKEVQAIPPDLMDASLRVSQLCREVDLFLDEKRATSSPMLQVPLLERGQQWTDKLAALLKQITSWREELITQIKS